MNYYDARPLLDGEGWHYTCRNDGRVWPVGYCSPKRTCPDCNGDSFMLRSNCATCDNKGVVTVDGCPPHATKEEAYECATRYMIDHAREVRVSTEHSVPRCEYEGCYRLVEDGFALQYGFGIPSLTILCPAHRNKESIAETIGSVGEVWSS